MAKNDFEYLNEERLKIWQKITLLEELLAKRTPEYEAEAKLSSEQAAEFSRNSQESKTIIDQYLEEATKKLAEIKTAFDSFNSFYAQTKSLSENAQENEYTINQILSDLQPKYEVCKTQISELEKLIEGKPLLEEKLTNLQTIFTKGNDYDSKLSVLHKSINERKKEIDELYYEILGYTDTDEEEKEIKVPGLKDQLETSYDTIKLQLDSTVKEIENIKTRTKSEYETFTEERKTTFDNSLEEWTDKYSKIEKRIEDLLPRALTAGLSHAYSEKKTKEENDNKRYFRTFITAIAGLILVSLIPFLLNRNAILEGKDLEQIILRLPRLVLAILPLYIPVLWVAYSSNRKMNLSKRLIEEYSHKEVLSKTFEGLSKQINNIEDKGISSDLRIRLLYNILEVNSENPGKLISNYNKSDHPLMDALDKSAQLGNAVTKLSKIPGFSKLANMLEQKANNILEKEAEKIEDALDSISNNKG